MTVLQKRLEKLFAAIMLNTKVVNVAEETGGIRVTFEGDVTPKEQTLRPCARRGGPPAELEDSRASIPRVSRLMQKGFIEVDGQRRTAEPSIFAIGDVAGEPMLAHKASHEARVAIDAIAGQQGGVRAARHSRCRLHRSRNRVVRADRGRRPRPAGSQIEVAKFPWGALSRAITVDRPDGLTKLVLDPKSAACWASALPAAAPAS